MKKIWIKGNSIFLLIITLFSISNYSIYGIGNILSVKADTTNQVLPSEKKTIPNSELDKKLDSTQQWINKFSDNIEQAGVTLISVKSENKTKVKFTSTKKLDKGYSAIIESVFGTTDKNADFKISLVNNNKLVATQVYSGTVTKSGESVQFTYKNSKTGKMETVNMSPGRSSNAAGLVLGFELASSGFELTGVAAAMAGALPAVLIIGGAALVVGAGYYAYSSSLTKGNYLSAYSSRFNVSLNNIASIPTLFSGAIDIKDIDFGTLQMNIDSANLNLDKLQVDFSNLGIAPIDMPDMSIPTIDTTIDSVQIQKSLNEFSLSMKEFSKEMTSLSKEMTRMSNEVDKIFSNWEYSSASPTVTDINFNKATKIFKVTGTMPSISKIDIYINGILIKSNNTDKAGKFDISIDTSISKEDVTNISIDAIQQTNNAKKYISYSITGLMGLINFKIDKVGQISTDSITNKGLKNPVIVEEKSKLPTISNVNYNKETKQFNISGVMPSESTIDIYKNLTKVQTVNSDSSGKFDINISAESFDSITFDAIQKSTPTIKYTNNSIYGLLSSPTFTISQEGLIAANKTTNDLLAKKLPTIGEKSEPVFSKVSFDSETGILNLIGDIATESSIDIYQNNQKINTAMTDKSGHFDLSIKAIKGQNVKIKATQKSTDTTIYAYKDFGIFTYPNFSITDDGSISVSENLKNSIKSKVKIDKVSAEPVFTKTDYDSLNKIMHIVGDIASKASLNIYINGVLDKTINSDNKGHFDFELNIEKGSSVAISATQTDTSDYHYYRFWGAGAFLAPTFNVKSTGEITVNSDGIDKNNIKTPIKIETVSARATIGKIISDVNQKTLSIPIKMPTKSKVTIEKSGIIETKYTDDYGVLKLELSIDNTQDLDYTIKIIQTDTNDTIYKPETTEELNFKVSPDGTASTDSATSLLIGNQLPITKPSITPKSMITPIPNVNPIPVGKGVTVQGKTLPNSDVIIKNKGISYKGKAGNDGVFSIPIGEVGIEDILEIFSTAPKINNILYTQSDGIKVSPRGTKNETSDVKIEGIPTEILTNLPINVQEAYNGYTGVDWQGNYKGQAQGTRAGGTYDNESLKLPTISKTGEAITYKEYDINNKIEGQNRDAERLLKGSDGNIYYTNNHYDTFIRILLN